MRNSPTPGVDGNVAVELKKRTPDINCNVATLMLFVEPPLVVYNTVYGKILLIAGIKRAGKATLVRIIVASAEIGPT